MIDKKKVLGRGLDSLLPAARATTAAAALALTGESVQQIPLENIGPNPYQTREHIDEAAMNELAASIKETGVVQPIVVRHVAATGKYQIIAGERRWMASQRAGKHAIPALVRQVSNQQAMEMTIIENLQREDLNPLEQAKAFERLAREFNLTQEQMAQKTGKDRTSVSNYLRLLKLPPEI
jgi:ParB family chromosome partitioning protein